MFACGAAPLKGVIIDFISFTDRDQILFAAAKYLS